MFLRTHLIGTDPWAVKKHFLLFNCFELIIAKQLQYFRKRVILYAQTKEYPI